MREHVAGLAPLDGTAPLPDGALDLRLGASRGTTILRLDAVAPLGLRRRNTVLRADAQEVVFATALRDDLLTACGGRRLPVA
jgi:hypothetical protein